MSFHATDVPKRRGLVFDLLSFDRMLTGPVIHLIYWGGLALILLAGFGGVGASVGLALRSFSLSGVLVAAPALVAGLLVMVVLALLWRGACEFFLAVFSIAEDLHALRAEAERKEVPRPDPLRPDTPRYSATAAAAARYGLPSTRRPGGGV